MPWKNELPMKQKQRFVSLAQSGHFTVTELCIEIWNRAQQATSGLSDMPVVGWKVWESGVERREASRAGRHRKWRAAKRLMNVQY